MITILEESTDDFITINEINNKAFGQPEEGNVIENIRKSDVQILSLVAEIDHKIVGHISYREAEITHNNGRLAGMGLASIAVLPEYQ